MRILRVMSAVAVGLALPVLASAQPVHTANSPTAEFHVIQAMVVGSETLPPGNYKFQCRHIDGKDFLIVTAADDGREVARVPCRPEELTKKVEISDFRSVPRFDGLAQLTAVRIKGEKVAHRVAVD